MLLCYHKLIHLCPLNKATCNGASPCPLLADWPHQIVKTPGNQLWCLTSVNIFASCGWYCIFFKNCLFICETEFHIYREKQDGRERERERTSIYCFTSQMATIAEERPGWSQQPRTPSGFPTQVQGLEDLSYLHCFPRHITGNWTGSGTTGKESSTHMERWQCGRWLPCCATARVLSLSDFLKVCHVLSKD